LSRTPATLPGMGVLIYNGERYDMEDMLVKAYRNIIGSIQKLGRTEWVPFPDWTPDGSRIVTYLLVGPGIPVTVQLADEGSGGDEFREVLRMYTKPRG